MVLNLIKIKMYNNTNGGIEDENLWFSTVNFPIGGQLVKYNIAKKNLTVFDLTSMHTIPLSVAEDEKGRVWTNHSCIKSFSNVRFLQLEI